MSPNDLGRNEEQDSVESASLETGSTSAADASVAEDSIDKAESAGAATRRPRKRVRKALRKFFLPPQGSRRSRRLLPWVTVLAILVGLVIGSAHMWAWTNSPSFCGATCHTMPPQYASYQLSAHSRVSCVECHIGREFIGKQLPRKAEHMQFIFRMAFGLYEYPIFVKGMRPARDACETCHSPAKFSNDSLVVKQHYALDEANSSSSISLVMHIGGGTTREGLGYGIHWHTENKVEFVSTDLLDQDIPYIRVTKPDGGVTEYTDITSSVDTSAVKQSDLKTMDCLTCHNRVSHSIQHPTDSVESSLTRGVISRDIPFIRRQAVKALTAGYANETEAFSGIARALDSYYKTSYPEFYATGADKLQAATTELQRIYSVSVFSDQLLDWNTHPDNLGHTNFPGCFRCHDGKHLDAAQKSVRLECNLCHSIPVQQGSEGLVTNIEIQHGPEPDSHRNANWIGLHNQVYVYDKSCVSCHTMADDGGTSNTSFCSNSACHGTTFPYAGFDAQALREVLQTQLPGLPSATPGPSVSSAPTWQSFVGPLFAAKCGTCHGANPSAGLNLTTYAGAMAGSTNGAVIAARDSANSLLVQVQSAPHHANLSAQELEAVKKWIDAGALEQ